MKTIFLGTPSFAVPSLQALYEAQNIEILAVITQPDKPAGRKGILKPPPLKIKALQLGLTVYQPENQKDLKAILKKLDFDFLVVIAYGMILKKEILDIPKIAPINVHASLLPKYRGASPIQEALIHGDQETGISIIKMSKKMDQGDVYLIKRFVILKEDNFLTLSQKLADLSAQLLPKVLEDISDNYLKPLPQNHSKASYCHKIDKNDGKINFAKSAEAIKNIMRAYNPWPGVFTEFKGKKLKIIEAEIDNKNLKPGEFKIHDHQLQIGTIEGSLNLKKLQFEGKNEMEITQFLNGYKQLFS